MSTDAWNHPSPEHSENLVHLSGLIVDYGPRRALNSVHLSLPSGEIFGLLGPNGAGKTTLFRVIASLLSPTRGRVKLCGHDLEANPMEVRSLIAYMPDLAPMPSDLRAIEYLRFFAEAHGLRGSARDSRVIECLEAVGLRERSREICTRLSLGMRQRLALAKSILHRPRLLILDEPASGLDPLARADLKEALRRQADHGATVILSSHIMAEIQELCTSIGLLQQGNLIDAGPIRKVLTRFHPSHPKIHLEAPGRRQDVITWLSGIPGVQLNLHRTAHDSIELLLDESQLSQADLFSALGAARLGVTSFRHEQTSVEEIVIRLGQSSIQ